MATGERAPGGVSELELGPAENGWVLEVGFFQPELPNKGRLHLGYMKKFFRTKADACEYYDRCNPHMRSLNAHGTYRSDWDPETRLFYVVRANHLFTACIEPFHETATPSGIPPFHDFPWGFFMKWDISIS